MIRLITIVCALSGLLFGFDAGIISGAILYLKGDFHIAPHVEGVIVSALPVGALLSAIISGRIIDLYGRKRTLFATSLMYLSGALLCAFAWSVSCVVVGRLLLGFGIGLSSTASPLYLSELSPKNKRGKVVTLYLIAVNSGIFLSYLSNYIFAFLASWRMMFFIAVIPSTVLFFLLFFIPESPRWLFLRGKAVQARQILSNIKNYSKQDVHDIQSNINYKTIKLAQINQNQKKLLWIGFGIGFFTQAVGINAIIYYAPTILIESGIASHDSAIFYSIAIGLTVMLAAIYAGFNLDTIGRKNLLLIGLLGIIVSLFLMTIFYYIIEEKSILAWSILACSVFFVACQGISVGPSCFLLPAEIFPIEIRGLGMSISMAANWLTNILVSFSFPVMLSIMGIANVFIVFGVISIIGWWFFKKYIFETKRISLEKIAEF